MQRKRWLVAGGGLLLASYSATNYALRQVTQAKRRSGERCLHEQQQAGLLPACRLRRLARRQVEIESSDGLKLRGWLLPSHLPSRQVMVMVHGYTVSANWMLHLALPFLDQGWTVLLVDQRAHGASQGRHATYGFMEKLDLQRWVNWVLAQFGEVAIGLLGQSMGGATVLEYAAINQRASFIIADCAYSDMGELIKYQLTRRHLVPAHPLYRLVDLRLQQVAGFRMRDVSPIRALAARPELPVMFIHGGRDDFVPTWMSQALYQAKADPKQLLIVPGAGHARSFFVDRELYLREVFAFVKQALALGRAPTLTAE